MVAATDEDEEDAVGVRTGSGSRVVGVVGGVEDADVSIDPLGRPPLNTVKGSSFLHVFNSIRKIGEHGSIFRSSVIVLACGYSTDTGLFDLRSHVVNDPSV